MGSNDRQEFIIMLLIENNCNHNEEFCNYFKKHYNIDKFNERYKELLDEFLNKYALDNTEKSEENL